MSVQARRQGVLRSKGVLLRVAGLLFCCFIITHCGEGQADRNKKKASVRTAQSGGIYRLPLLNNLQNLDPIQAEDQYSIAVVCQLYDGLVRFTPDLLIVPALAESWRIDRDGLVYHFLLQENARFHNGRPVTSQDVLFSFSRLIRTVPGPSVLPHILKIAGALEYRNHKADILAGVRVISEREFEIHLEEPYAPFLATLGMHQTRILPGEEVSREGPNFFRHPVGSGPFVMASWEQNKLIRLKRYPQYYLGPAYLDEVDFVIYPGGEIEAVLADFMNHKLEEMPAYGNIREKLASLKDVRWIHRSSLSLLFYGINCNNGILGRQHLRRALTMAIDRDRLASDVYFGKVAPARSILPPGILGYNPQHLSVTEDLDQARKEMVKSGLNLGDGSIKLEVVSSVHSPVAKAELEFIERCWTQLGIGLRTKFITDWAQFEKYIKSSSMQVYRYVWQMDIPDADNMLDALFGLDSNVNYMRFQDPEVEKMLRTARILYEPVMRADVYQRVEESIVRTAPLIPLVHLGIDIAYQSYVQGIELNALGRHNASLYRVYLSQEKER